jgi:hypothetical protein
VTGPDANGFVEKLQRLWRDPQPETFADLFAPDGTLFHPTMERAIARSEVPDYVQRLKSVADLSLGDQVGISDTCERPWDQRWLACEHEIVLRHACVKRNATGSAQAPDHIPLRYLVAVVCPLAATVRPFLGAKGHDQPTVDGMCEAWFKAVVLTAALWSRPYPDGEWWVPPS